AVAALAAPHLAGDRVGPLCQALETRPDGEAILRAILAQNRSPTVQALAAISLAAVLAGPDAKPTPQQLAEAERLLSDAVGRAKGVAGFPEGRLRDAEAALFAARNLAVGRTAPEVECRDAAGPKVHLS